MCRDRKNNITAAYRKFMFGTLWHRPPKPPHRHHWGKRWEDRGAEEGKGGAEWDDGGAPEAEEGSEGVGPRVPWNPIYASPEMESIRDLFRRWHLYCVTNCLAFLNKPPVPTQDSITFLSLVSELFRNPRAHLPIWGWYETLLRTSSQSATTNDPLKAFEDVFPSQCEGYMRVHIARHLTVGGGEALTTRAKQLGFSREMKAAADAIVSERSGDRNPAFRDAFLKVPKTHLKFQTPKKVRRKRSIFGGDEEERELMQGLGLEAGDNKAAAKRLKLAHSIKDEAGEQKPPTPPPRLRPALGWRSRLGGIPGGSTTRPRLPTCTSRGVATALGLVGAVVVAVGAAVVAGVVVALGAAVGAGVVVAVGAAVVVGSGVRARCCSRVLNPI
jgi:hypothetical protein